MANKKDLTMEKKWTGERLETFVFNEAMVEHLHRYAIAGEYVKDKIVLDIACGEGYGSNLLSKNARAVTGIDIDAKTINHASKQYSKNNLKFVQGRVENIPAPDLSYDVVVSFETLEHANEHEKIFSELKRVLKPGGLLIISTPEKKYYTDLPGSHNPFHLKEVYEREFIKLLSNHFSNHYCFYQSSGLSSVIVTEGKNEISVYEGNYETVQAVGNIDPLYLIAIASDNEIVKPASSILLGRSIFQDALNDKEQEIKNTLSYKTGYLLLQPLRVIRNMFKKQGHGL
jgi:ubiquinone/menaquinone biosynthesis C-methylase UbiE